MIIMSFTVSGVHWRRKWVMDCRRQATIWTGNTHYCHAFSVAVTQQLEHPTGVWGFVDFLLFIIIVILITPLVGV